jgi:hypothetical protein
MVWVAYAKMTFSISSQDIWVLLASNFGILLPPAFLLTFVSVHYGRERQFQEEYAFRSAIAMTLSAFAERLGTDEAAKKELIKNTVERLYQTPLLLSEKPKSASPLQLHAARSLVNGLKELVTEAKK